MKVILGSFILLLCSAMLAFGQIGSGGKPLSFQKKMTSSSITSPEAFQIVTIATPDNAVLKNEDLLEDNKGPLRVGVNLPVYLQTSTHGTWTTHSNGDRIWKLGVRVKDAKALGIYFSEELFIPSGGKLYVYNANKKQLLGAYTGESGSINAIEMVQGEELTLEYNAPKEQTESPIITIDEVVYFYRGVEEHLTSYTTEEPAKIGTCEVDVACAPESTGWSNQINSVVYFTFPIASNTYVCTASTINNTAQDCKPYILTGWHCGEPTTQTNISQWVWYWNYQKANCATGSGNTSNPALPSTTMTGGVVRASSGNGTLNNPPSQNQVPGSDFYLVELNSSPPANYNVYYAGWDRSNTAATSGVTIHHPDGGAKKISTFSSSPTSSSYNSGASNAHWRVTWVQTTNGFGVTEPGSSGAPLFNQNKRIIGQLTGGGASCSSPYSPDLYGKFFTSWDQCGTSTAARLKPWLDPGNTGTVQLDGKSACVVPTPPIADFQANPQTVSIGGSTIITDLSINQPTAWSWTITPATGWVYSGGTTATSQNPQLTFSIQGDYTVTLTASNALGSDTETKVNHIHVTLVTGPCSAMATECDEFIENVQLQAINNSSACNYYTDYANKIAYLQRGSTYTLTVVPQIVGQNPGIAYIGDEIAAWIDYNHDFVFDPVSERIAFVSVTNTWSNQFSFNVPQNAALGETWLRVRISYNGTDGGEGPINPCGNTQYGEVEDYRVLFTDQNLGLSNNETNTFDIYPNPSSNEIAIRFSEEIDLNQARLSILTLEGKVVQNEKIQHAPLTKVNVTHLAPGTYFIQLSDGAKTSYKRFIKQ